CQQYNRLPYSF
nr:immunoglobulin light chain junction region [Macaca mulatta]MOW42210.1 immunoglobulin light chain junction region [Macaca mulatta]MOW42256.1 immunoglobulin light chain junction region [Macaca mulatta]MOW43204.1 immunoglobulin light chain junction region [Macaca mulatta]MOW43651.1 immunoglobulin light chain junction region [Macaca mulatta]